MKIRLVIACIACCLAAVWGQAALPCRAAARFAPPQVPPSGWADTEAETNLVFDAGTAADNTFTLAVELDATASNNVEVAFGTDADDDGTLGLEEAAFVVGWDCGAWFYRDLCAGGSGVSPLQGLSVRSGETPLPPVRRKLEWTVYLAPDRSARAVEARCDGSGVAVGAQPTFFSGAWDMARVVVRGRDTTAERVAARVGPQGFAVRVR